MPIPPSPVRPRRAAARSRCARLACGAGLAAALALAPPGAHADICKYSDPEGNIHYSNLPPERGWKKLGCTIGGDPTVRPSGTPGSAGARASPSPAGFPRVDAQTQRSRDDTRKKVLADELASEEKQLAEARGAYADGAPAPLPEEKADAEKYRVRIGKLRQAVTLHERNVEALKKEIAAVK